MDISINVLRSAGRILELHITGSDLTAEKIAIAFQDGLRNHARGVLADMPKTLRRAESGGYLLICYPFYNDKRELIDSDICYELRRELLNPIRTML